jgi:hypothetical protein
VSAPASAVLDQIERRESWRRVVAGPLAVNPPEDLGHARVIRHNGVLLLCPLQVNLRCAAAAREAARSLPPVVVEVALDPAWAKEPEPVEADARQPSHDPAAMREVAGGGSGGDVRLRTLVAPWAMPWGWLLLVRPDERQAHSGTFLTPMSRARSRAARALKSLREHFEGSEVTDEVEEVARWLEDFHPRSMIELDERRTAALCDDGGVEDLVMGLECLAEGDATGVAAAYQRLDRRARRLQGWSRAS